MEVMKSRSFLSLFSATLVSWSVALVYIAHIGTMAEAGSLTNGAAIRGTFYTCGALGRALIGPLTDVTKRKLSLETWTFLTCLLCMSSALIGYLFMIKESKFLKLNLLWHKTNLGRNHVSIKC